MENTILVVYLTYQSAEGSGVEARINARVIAANAGSQRRNVQRARTLRRWEPAIAAITRALILACIPLDTGSPTYQVYH